MSTYRHLQSLLQCLHNIVGVELCRIPDHDDRAEAPLHQLEVDQVLPNLFYIGQVVFLSLDLCLHVIHVFLESWEYGMISFSSVLAVLLDSEGLGDGEPTISIGAKACRRGGSDAGD